MGRQRDLFWTVDGDRSADVVWHQLLEGPHARVDRRTLVLCAGKTVRQCLAVLLLSVPAVLCVLDVSR